MSREQTSDAQAGGGTGGSTPTTPAISELRAIAHDGKVVVVGTGSDGTLHYTVRQSGFEDTTLSNQIEHALPGFENWQPVPLGLSTDDPSVRAHEAAALVDGDGNPIMRSLYGADAEPSAVARVGLVSGMGHLYLFRVSPERRLLMNRFVLDGMTNRLVPKLEVRFRRSGQKLVPDGGAPTRPGAVSQDSLGFRDVEERTFYEPTQELTFLGRFTAGKPWFSVVLLPTAEHERHRWHFFVHTGGELRLVSVAASSEGLIDPKDQTKVQPDPGDVDRTVTRTVPGLTERRLRLDGELVDAFDATVYNNQVERQTKAGPQLMKDSTRVMLAAPLRRPGATEPAVAAVSFAVNTLGMLSQVDRVADREDLLRGDVKEVLLPLATLEDVKAIADRTPPPEGTIVGLAESTNELVAVRTGAPVGDRVRIGQRIEVTGTQSYDGVYVARNVDESTFEIDATFDGAGQDAEQDEGAWTVVEDEPEGLVFENMIASYERTDEGSLRISCLSHDVEEGDEIRITGSIDHDGTYPVSDVDEDGGFELERVWPVGEVVNLSRRPRRGLVFDGDGDHLHAGPVELPGHDVRARLERTVSAWVHLADVTGEPQTIFASSSGLLHLYVDGEGLLTLAVRMADGSEAEVVDSAPLPLRTWAHVAALLEYAGETTGETSLTLCRGGNQTAQTTVGPRKPLHLPPGNLALDGQAVAIGTLRYDTALPAAITLEGWINTHHEGRGVLASWHANGPFELAVDGDGERRVVRWSTTGHDMEGTVHLADDEWHHVAVTYDARSHDKAIYVDGALDSRTTAPPAVDDDTLAGATQRARQAETLGRPHWLGFLGAAAADRVTAGDVSTVSYPGGELRQVGPREWEWAYRDAGAAVVAHLTEVTRTERWVQLRDDTDSYQLRLNLHRGKVVRFDRDMVSQVATIEHGADVNARNANRIDTTDGSWQRTGATTWARYDQDGRPTGETRVEGYQDDWSIHLDSDTGSTLQLDLWKKRAEGGTVGGVRTITAAYAPALVEDGTAATTVDGLTTNRVDYAEGSWRRTDGTTWTQYDAGGHTTGETCRESGRDEWSVYLEGGAAAGRLQLNLWRHKICRLDGSTRTDLHDITAAYAPAGESEAAPNGRNVRRVAFARGRYELTGDGTWWEHDLDGKQVGDAFTEVTRDDWTVTVRATAGRYRLRFDLWNGTIDRIDDTLRREIADMSAADGPVRPPDDAGRYVGYLADVRVWNRARSQSHIRDLRAQRLVGNERNLVAHWLLDETAAPVLADLTRSKAHARPAGGARLAWDVVPHRAPGLPSQYEAGSYEDELTIAARLDPAGSPMPRDGFRGQISDVQLWTANRPVGSLRDTMYQQLSGNENGLAGYWRCGGILADPAPGSGARLSPDFAAGGHDAVVHGDTYVAARALPRQTSAGRVVRFANDDLVAVSPGARYRETFEFRAETFDGTFLDRAAVDDADGHGNRLFELRYWGRRSRTGEAFTEFDADERYDFADLGDGWFRARCDITVPDGVHLIRCFEIDRVCGRWTDQLAPPDDEWFQLAVRKHRLEVISDSVSRRSYTDELDLPTLVGEAAALERSVEVIPLRERDVSARRVELDKVLEALAVFANRERFDDELAALDEETPVTEAALGAARTAVKRFEADPLNYRQMLRSKDSGMVLDQSRKDPRIVWMYRMHAEDNQAWEFERHADGVYRIASVSSGRYLTAAGEGEWVGSSPGDGPDRLWTVVDHDSGYHLLRNPATGCVLDVYRHGDDDRTRVVAWPRHGESNQLWELVGWYPGLDGRRRDPERHPQPKSTYDAEIRPLLAQRDRLERRLSEMEARRSWLAEALADQTAARERTLLAQREQLEQRIRDLQDDLDQRNADHVATAREIAAEAQTMALVAEDPLGLQTYGAILGFAAPAGGLTTTATAEGNVTVGYFDTQGRMRATSYDATSDTTNGAYEQWLPSTIAVCPDLRRPASMVRLEEGSPIGLDPAGHTTEAWLHYPPPFRDDGTPYPLSMLTSDAGGRESAIAVAGGRRLGTVVDGFFHDAGVDLATHLDRGWHHVAATADGGATRFHLDGEPVGHGVREQLDQPRHAVDLPNGGLAAADAGYLDIGPMAAATHDYSEGFTVQTWVRFTTLSGWPRLLDLGAGAECIRLVGHDLGARVVVGDVRLNVPRVLRIGEWTNLAATVANGIAVLYVDGSEVGRGEMPNPASVDRTGCSIGRDGAAKQPLDGTLSAMSVWNRGLSAEEVRGFMFTPPTGDEDGLLHAWPMRLEEDGDGLRAVDVATAHPQPARLVGTVAGRPLDRNVSAPVVALGNRVTGGAPAGKLAHLRFWSAPLTDEEIRVNSLVTPTGNEPDLTACYPLDDVTGGTGHDLTGRHRPGTVQAADPAACTARIGAPGHRVSRFGGPTARVALPGGLPLSRRSFTVELWLKRERTDGADWVVWQGKAGKNQLLHIGARNTGAWSMAFYGNDMNVRLAETGEPAWCHIANVYDHEAGHRTVYVNGDRRGQHRAAGPYEGAGDLEIGFGRLEGQLAELRVWDHARSAEQIAAGFRRRAAGTEEGLLACLPFDDGGTANTVPGGVQPAASGVEVVRSDDLPIRPAAGLATAEYSTVGPDPELPTAPRAMLRRFYGFAGDQGQVTLLPGKRIEELTLRWIGNAQFEPTLLGYIEGAPPVPSENLTVNYDYDAASSVELVQADDVSYSWTRNVDNGHGADFNLFLGAAWSTSGGAFIQTTISEGHIGARATANIMRRMNRSTTVRAASTATSRDRLELRGAYEIDPKFPHLGNRFVPKNVGYALVVSGLADVFVTQMKRTGRMVAYEVLPVEDVPPDVSTITFMINPAYTSNGSLDGQVGSRAADERFYRHVPEMRAQYGSRYPASYFDLRQAYDLKAQITRWEKERESYFVNFDVRQRDMSEATLDQVPGAGTSDRYGRVEVDDGRDGGGGADGSDGGDEEARQAEQLERTTAAYADRGADGKRAAEAKQTEIARRLSDPERRMEASSAFASWQRRMERLKIRAAKRNIVNTYVWDADGGIRSEEENFANTVEHTIGGSFSISGTAGADFNIINAGFKAELQAMYALDLSQSVSKTAAATRSFDLAVRLDGVERKGVTDADDYPVQPGEKVDRYRFMSFYLEGDIDHFSDFFSYVVDPEWLMSNDEEARALRQVARGRPNKTWRVLHRVTQVERPALLGFGEDLRTDDNIEAAAQEVFNYFDALERSSAELRADIGALQAQLTQVGTKVDRLAGTANGDDTSAAGAPADTANGDGLPAATPNGDEAPDVAKLDLNEATVTDLETLPGLDPSTAAAIVALRDELGGFTDIYELGYLDDLEFPQFEVLQSRVEIPEPAPDGTAGDAAPDTTGTPVA